MDQSFGRCATCRFWDGEDDGRGLCYRYPPLPTTQFAAGDIASLGESWRPEVGYADWCGEYQEKR